MPGLPRSKQSRSAFAAAVLVGGCALSVLLARGLKKPWVPDCPPFRQAGPPGAKAVIVEYSDFECPACRVGAVELKALKVRFGDKVRVMYKHFPLERIHPWAKRAALVAECAGRQGRFWELHDLLYLKQDEWSSAKEPAEVLTSYAEAAGLEPMAFFGCLKDPAAVLAIEADMKEAKRRWVNSTPTFFVNGKRFVGARQLRTDGLWALERMLK